MLPSSDISRDLCKQISWTVIHWRAPRMARAQELKRSVAVSEIRTEMFIFAII